MRSSYGDLTPTSRAGAVESLRSMAVNAPGGSMTKLVLLLALIPTVAAADKSFSGDKNATWDCTKDPEVSITSDKATFTLTGACKSLSVSGNDVKLTIESIADL